MKSAALFLVLLVVTANSISLLQKYPLNFSSKRSIPEVLAEVKAKIKAGAPLGAVLQLLTDLRTQIIDEQNRHNEVARNQRQVCDDELSFRSKEINAANGAVSDSESREKDCEIALEATTVDLNNNKNQQRVNRETIDDLTHKREEQIKLLAQRRIDHQDAIAAIAEAVEYVKQIYEGAPNISGLSQIAVKLLKLSMKTKLTSHYAPVAAVLAQIASKKVLANEASLQKVLDLFQKLDGKLKDSLRLYNEQEEADRVTFENNIADLNAWNRQLEEEQKKLEASIVRLETCVADQRSRHTAAQAKFKRNSELNTYASEMCQSFVQEFEIANAKRAEELKLIETLEGIVKRKYQDLNSGSEYVYDRLDTDADKWAAYDNLYRYKQADAVVRQKGDFNAQGADQAGFDRDLALEALQKK